MFCSVSGAYVVNLESASRLKGFVGYCRDYEGLDF